MALSEAFTALDLDLQARVDAAQQGDHSNMQAPALDKVRLTLLLFGVEG